MLDERDMQQERKWHYEQAAQRCVSALKKNNINAWYAPERNEARSKVLELIPEAATIGIGDSVTLYQVGVIQELESREQHRVFNPFLRDERGQFPVSGRELIDVMKKALTADVFLLGTNAVTLDGKLVNVDALGNRVGGLIFGPRKVIVVVGANKIVNNVDEALKRIREVAAPVNAKRHNLKHGMATPPCAITGVCSDCRHAARICCYTVIVDFQRPPAPGRQPRINVILVGEELGI